MLQSPQQSRPRKDKSHGSHRIHRDIGIRIHKIDLNNVTVLIDFRDRIVCFIWVFRGSKNKDCFDRGQMVLLMMDPCLSTVILLLLSIGLDWMAIIVSMPSKSKQPMSGGIDAIILLTINLKLDEKPMWQMKDVLYLYDILPGHKTY